jgi:leucyl-tRNA---protein transferase
MSRVPNIDEAFFATRVARMTMDELWATGWRHQGHLFFRYDACEMQGSWHQIVPVRIKVAEFRMSRSQRRVWRKNQDLRWEIGPAVIDDDTHDIFNRHRVRFSDNVPENIHCFFSDRPSDMPCDCVSLRAYLNGKLVAVSFLDYGLRSTSSVYAIFDPEHSRRGLGTLTLLKELELSAASGKEHLYPGYATREASHYDYKKTFNALQGMDWPSYQWLDWDGSTEGPPVAKA